MARVVNQHRPEIDELVGKKIDGIIGTDCLKSNNLLIDFPGSNLSISQKPLDTTFRVPMRNFFGLPIFEIYMNGVKINAAYDSGAMYSFVASTHLETLALTAQNKSYEDYNPILGQFTANLYTGDIRIGDKNLGSQNIAIGSAYDQSLQMVGIDAMIGTDALKQSIVGFSYIENRMGV